MHASPVVAGIMGTLWSRSGGFQMANCQRISWSCILPLSLVLTRILTQYCFQPYSLGVWLKVSKFRKQIFKPKLLQKNEPTNCFSILTTYQDRKTNLVVRFLEKVLAGKFVFDFYWPLVIIFIFRFDTKVHVDLPDVKGRQELIEHYLSKLNNVGQIDSKFWARKTIRFSGADIENMVNTAAINAAVKGM